ncbi:hypothetical protein BDQ12DRAFT_738868 [Crucibulum laeve]|uniref:Uncharacterized protein n=1 Tax=Crucibulum laeve TaxID=68775 RepID=A0A5C3LKL6_9AGAR|nr:hypothetical protein BDQ12DRAFT_738868 [Crucibulum laeve]
MKFKIGTTKTYGPLVGVPEIKAHLAVLHGFSELKAQVDVLGSGDQVRLPDMPADKDRRWTWFVGLSLERFDRWCHSLRAQDVAMPLIQVVPPLDVLMVWHAYMLNPRWFAEDSSRLEPVKILKKFWLIFSSDFSNQLAAIVQSPPTHERTQFWYTKTSMPFDPFESAIRMRGKAILCPQCRNTIHVSLMNAQGTGYLQENFNTRCARGDCQFLSITKERLALRKLAQDIAVTGSDQKWLAGTLYTKNASIEDTLCGTRIKRAITDAAKKKRKWLAEMANVDERDEKMCQAIMNDALYDIGKLRSAMEGALRGSNRPIVGKIMSAYRDDKIYSIDLVGAVLRQGSFIEKMHSLHWTEPGFFDSREDKQVLDHAIARYHAFLDLLSSSPASFFVPTLDIDLAWHTHQLMAPNYERDCVQYVGRFIDHDDKVGGIRLSSAFDMTCRAWKSRFNLQYTHCGCPIPGDTIGQKLRRLMAGPTTDVPSLHHTHLIPPQNPHALDGSHPSDHNAVRVLPQNKRMHQFAHRRYDKQRKKAERARSMSLGAGDRRRRNEHEPAFLVPVPIFYGDAGVLGCVAACGSVVQSGTVGGCAGGSGFGGCSGGGVSCGGGGGWSCGGGGGGGSSCGGGGGGDGGGGGGGGGGGCGGGS